MYLSQGRWLSGPWILACPGIYPRSQVDKNSVTRVRAPHGLTQWSIFNVTTMFLRKVKLTSNDVYNIHPCKTIEINKYFQSSRPYSGNTTYHAEQDIILLFRRK